MRDDITDGLAAIFLGALIGTLIGLSGSPVVATVLGTLVSGALIFMSVVSSETGKIPIVKKGKSVRILLFSLSATVALLAGVLARNNYWLGGSQIERQYHDLLSVGIDESQAQRAVLQFFLSAEERTEDIQRAPILFSNLTDDCDAIDLGRISDISGIIAAFTSAGPPWENVKDLADDEITREKLEFVHRFLCEGD
jgi:hypothetical protein